MATQSTTQPTREELLAKIAQLEREKQQAVSISLSCKASPKGCVAVYGLGRWPVSLYPEQWIKLLAFSQAILRFIDANKTSLSWKN